MGSVSLDGIRAALDEYLSKYRRDGLPTFELSGIYDLFPGEHRPRAPQVTAAWPDRWPNTDHPGVYLILDRSTSLRLQFPTSWHSRQRHSRNS